MRPHVVERNGLAIDADRAGVLAARGASAGTSGAVLSKTQLLTMVWGFDHHDVNLVEVHVSALRRKLEAAGPRIVHTVRGVGLRPAAGQRPGRGPGHARSAATRIASDAGDRLCGRRCDARPSAPRPGAGGPPTRSSLGAWRPTWETVIGLEVHTELATATKLFCGCPNRFGDEPNTNVCPVCLGLPGLAAGAQRAGGRAGHAPGPGARAATVRRSVFARKNYFYPDMPKDYQISQYDLPINVDGELELPSG